jgi:YjbE family integral membrane protein
MDMEFLTPAFFSALFAIVIIDLVLAGDNAVVIALAARKLPPDLQKRAIIWGAVGAVVVRSVMTLGVVWLLGMPGLRFVGGLFLLWIAYKLLVPTNSEANHNVAATTSFWAAMKTIVIADAVMGVDNVLAVAGAAHGSYLLVVLGLLISIPIVIWGSTLILRYTERFPAIIYIGAAVLVITSIKMMLAEPIVATTLADANVVKYALYAVLTTAILAAGYAANTTQRLKSALRAHMPVRREYQMSFSQSKGNTMNKVLLPVDGSDNSLHAVRKFVQDVYANPNQEVLLLNVQPKFNRHIGQFVSSSSLQKYRTDQAESATRAAQELLKRSNISYKMVMGVGPRAEVIAETATQHRCDKILLATARKNSLTRLLENSVTAKLLEIASVPVEIVVGPNASKWERFGIPMGIGGAIAALLMVAD